MFLYEKIILFLHFLFHYINNSPILKISLETLNDDNFICTRICFGSYPQCFNLQIDLQLFYVMIYNKTTALPAFTKAFDIFNSTTFSLVNKNNVNIKYQTYVTEAYGAIEQISIDNIFNISDFKFVLVNRTISKFKFDGIIGLGYLSGIGDPQYFFLEQLYTQKIISHYVFGFEFSSYKTTQLFFGDVPTIIIKDYYHYGNCDLVKQKYNDSEVYNNNWECKLISLQLSKTHQKIRK